MLLIQFSKYGTSTLCYSNLAEYLIQVWAKMRCALPQNITTAGSYTTRNSRYALTLMIMYTELDHLRNLIQKCPIFQENIWQQVGSSSPTKGSIRNQIREKCCGSPLTIINIASLFAGCHVEGRVGEISHLCRFCIRK